MTDSNEAPFVEIPSTEFPYGIIWFLKIHLQQYTKLTYNSSIEITFSLGLTMIILIKSDFEFDKKALLAIDLIKRYYIISW